MCNGDWKVAGLRSRQAEIIKSACTGQILEVTLCQCDIVLLKKDHACSVTSAYIVKQQQQHESTVCVTCFIRSLSCSGVTAAVAVMRRLFLYMAMRVLASLR